jgi:hypothetical protein
MDRASRDKPEQYSTGLAWLDLSGPEAPKHRVGGTQQKLVCMNRRATAMNTNKRVASCAGGIHHACPAPPPPRLLLSLCCSAAWLCMYGLRNPSHVFATDVSCESREGAPRHFTERSPLRWASDLSRTIQIICDGRPICLCWSSNISVLPASTNVSYLWRTTRSSPERSTRSLVKSSLF